MNAKKLGQHLLGCLILSCFTSYGAQSSPPNSPPPVSQTLPQPTPYQVVSRDANQNVWERTTYEKDLSGEIVTNKHSYTELATGLNHLVNGKWVESKEEIDILPNGTAAAINGQHQVYFPSDIYNGQIKMVTPDGKVLRSQPLGLSYDDGNNTVLIAVLTNSVGELVSPNQVIYPNAFVGVNADLRYTYMKGGFEQDVILHEQPSAPEDFNLDPQTTKLQLMTEFFNPPQPSITATPLPTQAGMALNDDNLNFGVMQMVQGKAFLLGQDAHDAGAGVGKQWLDISGRQILIEEVPVMALAQDLLQLPVSQGASAKVGMPLHIVSSKRLLPEQHLAKAIKSTLITKALSPNKGLVLDYVTLNSSLTNYTFKGDTTYYISGAVNLYGTNTVEGGTVLKYAPVPMNFIFSSVNLMSGSTFNCQTSPYRPAVFTARDDNTVGETISGSTGNPTNYYGSPALNFNISATLSNFRIAWAGEAISASGSNIILIRDGQLVNCSQYGIVYWLSQSLTVQNLLFANVKCGLMDNSFTTNLPASIGNSTFSGCAQLFEYIGNLRLTNCILANVTNITYTSGDHNGFYNSPAFGTSQVTNTFYPFQTVGAGSYYLTNGCAFTNAGTTNIDPTLLADLRTKTTWPPMVYSNVTISTNLTLSPQAQRDTNAVPNLGYHYDPIDYIVDNLTITNAMLTLTNGVAIASYNSIGVQLQNSSSISSIGSPLYPNWIVLYSSVQEQSVALDGWNGYAIAVQPSYGVRPNGQYHFTKFACPAYGGIQLYDYYFYSYSSLNVQECEFWGSNITLGGNTNVVMTLDNNLFVRSTINAANISGQLSSLSFSNNLVWGSSSVRFAPVSGSVWYAYNNNFDSSTFSSSTLTNGYNAYLNCSGRLSPTNAFDIVTNVTLAYQTGPLGMFYQPTNSPLINTGSTTADQVGLYHYTTQTNQVPESNSVVDIGYHYVAVDTNGKPVDTDGDGIPDYIEDANGDGVYDAGDPSDWTDYYNSVLPTLAIVTGNYQCGAPGSLLPIALSVRVTDTNNIALSNAPLTFTVTQGGLATATNGVTTNSIMLRTGINGQATVYYTLPSITNADCFVNAMAWSGTNSRVVTFKEHTQTPIIAAGYDAAFYLTSSGHVLSWGDSSGLGILGGGIEDGATNIPIEIPNLTNIIKVVAGEQHTLALAEDGTLWAWGWNADKQLGTNTDNYDEPSPVVVPGLTNVIDITAGAYNSIALEADGTVWQWGYTIGTDDITNPVQVVGITNAKKISAGDQHVLILLQDGTIKAWGANRSGQLGNGTYDDSFDPVVVTNLSNIIYIAAGYEHSLAIDSSNSVWGWGDNYAGELGATNFSKTNVAVQIASLSNIVQVACGADASLATDISGKVWQWGYWGYWSYQWSAIPFVVTNLPQIVEVSAGSWNTYSFALATKGVAFSWGGYNAQDSELGYGLTPTSNQFNNNQPNTVYLNSVEPQIQILQGNNQAGHYFGTNFSQSLIFQVNDPSGNFLSNAPVYVQVAQGDLLISTNQSGDRFSDLRLNTDTNGRIQLFAYVNGGINTNCLINVYAATPDGGLGIMTNFQETIYVVPPPTIHIVQGNNQAGHYYGTNFPQSLVLNVTDENGHAMTNFPVNIEVDQGDLQLRTNQNSSLLPSLEINTDTNGIVSFFAYVSAVINTNCEISVSVPNPEDGLPGITNFQETIYATPPTISITSPTNGTMYLTVSSLFTNVLVSVSISNVDGVIQGVDFYDYGTKIGNSTNSPFSFSWNMPLGSHLLTAVATNGAGETGTSAPVNIVFDRDADGDGIPDFMEIQTGTNPTTPDTPWSPPSPDPSDHTPPTIYLDEPANVTQLP